jgi:hypothetical protein
MSVAEVIKAKENFSMTILNVQSTYFPNSSVMSREISIFSYFTDIYFRWDYTYIYVTCTYIQEKTHPQ